MPDWIEGRVTANRQWTERLFSLRFSAAIGNFKPGQFVRVALELGGEIVARPYSLVNAPDESEFEIFFNIVPEGPLTPMLAALRQGDVIKVAEKPYGFLTIDEVPAAKHLWMIATGTGVGPFVSILKSEEAWQRFEKVVLVYSVRTAQELAYQDAIAEAGEKYHQQLSFVPLVTREQREGAINKRVTDAIESGELEQQAGISMSPEDSHVMMCGNSAMIADVMELLKSRNMRKHLRREPGHITTEKYH
jgi:ferredoxin--NADP+ reductase